MSPPGGYPAVGADDEPAASAEPSLPEVLAALVGGRAAARLSAAFGTVFDMARAPDEELVAAGLPARKVRVLRAAVALGRRSLSGIGPGRRLGGASEVALYYRGLIGAEQAEEFHALALDVRHRVIKDLLVARGSLTGVEVHPRDVFRELIRLGAVAVIFCHNHPSGDPTPSREDVELTRRLRYVGEMCGIAVLDHVVVTAGGAFVSLAERAWTSCAP